MLQWNKIKYYTNTNETAIIEKTLLSNSQAIIAHKSTYCTGCSMIHKSVRTSVTQREEQSIYYLNFITDPKPNKI